jgi:hypothetical protein
MIKNFFTALIKQAAIARKLLSKLFSLNIVRFGILLIVIILLAPEVFFISVRPVPQTNINYGVTFSKKYAQEIGLDWKGAYLEILDELNVKNMRLIAYWDDSEPVVNNYNFSDIEWQLNEAQKRDISVIMTIGRKVPRYPECFEPIWYKKLTDEKVKESLLDDYIRNAVYVLKDYKAIKMWQVENEPFFPFGECTATKKEVLENEIKIVRSIDKRPIILQDSGEGGFWFPSYKMADYLGISMYRKTWFDFWGIFIHKSFYVQYPLEHWAYKVKSVLTGVPVEKIMVTELQAEPWGPVINSKLTDDESNKTMSKQDFLDTITYAQKSGFKDLYLWGVEWWLWQKDIKNNPYYWDTAKALFR